MKYEIVRLTTQDVGKGILVTDSKIISEKTNKTHSNVQRLILKYQDHLREFGKVGTQIRTTVNNQQEKVYLLNEMQSIFLITLMRNNEQVLTFKKELVKAFFIMRNELQARKETRNLGVSIRRSLTDAIKNKVDDDTNFKHYAYSNYSKLVYKKVLGTTVKKFKESHRLKANDNVRNFLDMKQIEQVQELESKIAAYIEMRKDIIGNDKEIYQEVKKYVDGL